MNNDVNFLQDSEVWDGGVGQLGHMIAHKLGLGRYVGDARFAISGLSFTSQQAHGRPNLMEDIDIARHDHSMSLRRPVSKNNCLVVQ